MNLSQIRHQAAEQLRENGNTYSRLVLIHSAITTGVSLVLLLVTWLSQYIAPEGGLSNMDTQTLLTTGQTLLQIANTIALPFWNAGLIFCTFRFLRGQDHSLRNLTEGFLRWGSISSSLIIRGVIYFFISMSGSLLSSILISTLPLPASLLDDLTAFAEAPAFPLPVSIQIFMAVYVIIYMVSLLVLLVPRLYSHRLVAYRIMDEGSCGGMQAVLHSRLLMKGKRKNLFLLDLSFWWFYLLEFVISFLSMGDLILAEFGIVIPIDTEITMWVFPMVTLLLRLALYYYAKPKLTVTYAIFYQQVLDESQTEPEAPQPKQMPWNY